MECTNFFLTFEKFGCISMGSFKVHIIHVGNMANKGTRALLKSDISVVRDIVNGDVAFSVSTTDIEGVKRLNLSLDAVLQPMVDIPYEKADAFAKRFGYTRASLKYKVFAIGSLIFMFVQALMSLLSVVLFKLGLKGFYRVNVLEHVKNSHVVVSYSDENFKEAASLLPLNVYWVLTWWSMLFSRTWDVLIAKFLGRRVVMFPNSIGPFRTRLGRFLSKLALNRFDCILVREPVSYDVVNSLGIRSPKRLTSDTTLLLIGTHSVTFESLSKPLVGVSPGFYSHSMSEKEIDKYIVAHARALDETIEKYGFSVVFLPHYVSGFRYDDLEVCRRILRRMRNKDRAKIVDLSCVEEFKSSLNQMDMVISSKMHPAVLATSGFVPTLCIAYDQKQTGFFQRLDLTDCVISIREVSYERLFLKISYVWNRKDEIRALLKEKIPSLQEDIRKAVKYALASFVEVK